VGGKIDQPKWGQDLSQALKKGKDESEQFISALNLGLSTGANIISDESTAYHEAGHAVVSWVLRPEIPVNRIQVKREKDSLGVTMYDGDSPHFRRGRRRDYLVELCISLAGRAAESIKFGLEAIDTGAASDLEYATKRAWSSIAYYGLDPDFGPIDLSIFKEPTGWLFDEAQKRLQGVMKEAAARTNEILVENWIHVEVVAAELIAKGEVNFEEFVTRLTMQGLEDVAGVVEATNIPLKREVEFAQSSGSHQTPEGFVRYEVGDAIVKDENGDSWPVSRPVFDRLYRPFMGVNFGENGHYHKVENTVRALQLTETSRIDMLSGRGVLLGEKGDWIVDYGNGDLAIVNEEAFERTYRVV
jgi:Peptidase family M41/PGDYG protein